jgi:hypothetical protein
MKDDFTRAESVSEKDMEIIHLSRDVLALGQVIKDLGGSMAERVRAAMHSEQILNLHGIELSGAGYWRDGELLVTHDELEETAEGL